MSRIEHYPHIITRIRIGRLASCRINQTLADLDLIHISLSLVITITNYLNLSLSTNQSYVTDLGLVGMPLRRTNLNLVSHGLLHLGLSQNVTLQLSLGQTIIPDVLRLSSPNKPTDPGCTDNAIHPTPILANPAELGPNVTQGQHRALIASLQVVVKLRLLHLTSPNLSPAWITELHSLV